MTELTYGPWAPRRRRRLRSRRLRQRLLALGEGPVEPQRERLDICALDRRTAPDAQARRRIAVSIDVVSDALLLERGGDALDEAGLRFGGKFCHRWIDHPQAHRGVGPQRRIAREKLDPRRSEERRVGKESRYGW